MKDNELLAIMYDFYNEHTLRDQNKDIQYYINKILEYSANKILIIGAGTGRVAIPLSEYADVTALDMDSARLKLLKQKKSSIKTICADFKNFNTEEDFDMIILPYSTLQFGDNLNQKNECFKKLHSLMNEKTILLFDVSESFNTKPEKQRELIFSDYCSKVNDDVDVYYSSKRNKDNIEFFVEYYLVKAKRKILEQEKYWYYNKSLLEKMLDKSKIKVLKIDNGYGDNIFTHKHLFHCRRQ